MKVHHSIMHHVKRRKEQLFAHIQKHHKKYIFAGGVAFWRSLLKSIMIAFTLLGISMVSQPSNAAGENEELQIYKALDVFNRINDLAHLEMKEAEEEGNPFTERGKKLFDALDLEFHNDTGATEKFRTAKKIVNFLIEQEKYHMHTNNINSDSERDSQFIGLLDEFSKIR